MKVATLLGLMLVLSIGTGASAVGDDVMKQLVPTGKLRVGVAYAPASTPIFVAKNATGDVHGVPLDLGNALARTLGVPIEIVVVATTGELADACSSGAIDIGFMPADDERRTRVDFSPPYFVIKSTYLVADPSPIKTLAEVDRREVTVVGIAGSTTMRAAGRSLKNAKVVPAKSVDEAMGMMKAGTAQAEGSRCAGNAIRPAVGQAVDRPAHRQDPQAPATCGHCSASARPVAPPSQRQVRL